MAYFLYIVIFCCFLTKSSGGKLLHRATIESRTDFSSVSVDSGSECVLRCAFYLQCAGVKIKNGICHLMDDSVKATKADCEGNETLSVYYGKISYFQS